MTVSVPAPTLLVLIDAVEAAHDPYRWDEFLAICRERFDFGESA